MASVISNTSPLLYLHRVGGLNWLPRLFDEVWVPPAVARELEQGRRVGVDVPNLGNFPWLQIVAPRSTPTEWFAADLGPGEIAAMSLALEDPGRIILLDDALARRVAEAAGLVVWGTLRVVLEAKSRGLTPTVAEVIERLERAGMWISSEICQRVMRLAGEEGP